MVDLRQGWLRLLVAARSVHHKVNPKDYPKINISDVSLTKPRQGFRKERPPLLSQSVTTEVFPAEAIKEKYLEAGKPVPIKYASRSDAIARRNYEFYKDLVAMGLPHFKVGEKEVYFPKARVCLLRPNAKHTPYQAKFLVPRNFNKMDLRDYLWNVYGLRALNVTVQLLHARMKRNADDLARHRAPQYKKMTIDMEEPFVWPDLPEHMAENASALKANQIKAIEVVRGNGSDKLKSNDAFDGLYKKPELPDVFVSKKLRASMKHAVVAKENSIEAESDRAAVKAYLGL